MNAIDELLESLKRSLKNKGLTYAILAEKMGLSESSVKRLFSRKDLSFKRLEQICHLCDLSFAEICREASFADESSFWYPSYEQEKVLAKNPRLLNLFTFLRLEKTPKEIMAHYQIDEKEMESLLLELDRAQLIELHSGNKVKLVRQGRMRFHRDGAVGRAIFEHTKSSFLQSEFIGEFDYIRFGLMRLTPNLVNKLQSKLEKVMLEMQEDSRFISEDDTTARELGVLFSFRPWHLDRLDAIKKR